MEIYIVITGLTYEGGVNILGAYTTLAKAIAKANSYLEYEGLSEEKLYIDVDASMYNNEYYVKIKAVQIDS